jgi:hypothetical protein
MRMSMFFDRGHYGLSASHLPMLGEAPAKALVIETIHYMVIRGLNDVMKRLQSLRAEETFVPVNMEQVKSKKNRATLFTFANNKYNFSS